MKSVWLTIKNCGDEATEADSQTSLAAMCNAGDQFEMQ